MPNPTNRDDLSRFVVHLTRQSDDDSSIAVLADILASKRIEARNAHCLFKYEFERLHFTEALQNAFCTACFTETPLSQIKKLADPKIDRRIQLEPCGIVFSKQFLIDNGGNPAVYINAHDDDSFKRMLLDDFRFRFRNARTFQRFKKKYPKTYKTRIRYYSLINVLQSNHDFMWEREWRHNGDLEFRYFDVVAVICPKPQRLRYYARRRMTEKQLVYLDRMPTINAEWALEEIVQQMSETLWENARRSKVIRR